ncbi:MAG: excinuclease ABC subunit UvrB [Candidatus Muirbacterium halophilum]|nr:excinuclease ABC subunit UvrB [Candidatus Muirbacterium halophilum]MCK9476940.1 excinuclease ABC subunit UvrB [Candidatus Muirbacterium halophilum]
MQFKLVSPFSPAGDQPQAIDIISQKLNKGVDNQILLGVTGSGKTFAIANIIQKVQRPVLILTHNKTLAAQLFNEFKLFFPYNAVEYFVSYYDYFQPESYIVHTDTYIEKDAGINEQIDRLRHNATASLLSRNDVIVVSSVSAIYNIGKPDFYINASILLQKGNTINREEFIEKLIDIHYERNDFSVGNGLFRVRGEIIDITPPYFDGEYIRIEFFDDEIEKISLYSFPEGILLDELDEIKIFPAKHYIIPDKNIKNAISQIKEEMFDRIKFFKDNGKLIEAQRIEERTRYDVEMIKEFGYCKGIENYSRYFDGRKAGEAPWSLIPYFSDDYLLIVDESHITIPQIGGMFKGDNARKKNLIDYGFRLPSAYDNRPLNFKEFEERKGQTIYVSATPGKYENEIAKENITQLIVRPTGITEPEITVIKSEGQIFKTIEELNIAKEKNLKVIINTLTKKMSEELTEYLLNRDFRVKYLHSEIKTIDRTKIINELRRDEIDIIIGVNLLREGIDLPEVGLVIIFDGDKEGFLRSDSALIQLCGRCARNIEGKVIIFADRMTNSMNRAISIIDERRKKQIDFNLKNNIIPKNIESKKLNLLEEMTKEESIAEENINELKDVKDLKKQINNLKYDMKTMASLLNFEKAAELRDRIKVLEEILARNSR